MDDPPRTRHKSPGCRYLQHRARATPPSAVSATSRSRGRRMGYKVGHSATLPFRCSSSSTPRPRSTGRRLLSRSTIAAVRTRQCPTPASKTSGRRCTMRPASKSLRCVPFFDSFACQWRTAQLAGIFFASELPYYILYVGAPSLSSSSV